MRAGGGCPRGSRARCPAPRLRPPPCGIRGLRPGAGRRARPPPRGRAGAAALGVPVVRGSRGPARRLSVRWAEGGPCRVGSWSRGGLCTLRSPAWARPRIAGRPETLRGQPVLCRARRWPREGRPGRQLSPPPLLHCVCAFLAIRSA